MATPDTLRPPTIPVQVVTDVLYLIDERITQLASRELISAPEEIDVLLDLRALLTQTSRN